jgi:hypothetical protein
VDSVSLLVTRGVDIPGRVTFEGQAAASAQNLKISIQARDEDFAFSSQQEEDVEKDGMFSLTEMGDGTYTIRASSKCEECYIKSASANGINLLDSGLVIESGQAPRPIEIVFSSNTGKASGTVTGADDLPLAAAYVMLIKDVGNKALRAVGDQEDSKSATTDQYGKFEIRGVPPGRYKALAWQKFDADSSGDPETIKPLADKADSFEVTAGATAALQLKAIPTSASEPSN